MPTPGTDLLLAQPRPIEASLSQELAQQEMATQQGSPLGASSSTEGRTKARRTAGPNCPLPRPYGVPAPRGLSFLGYAMGTQ